LYRSEGRAKGETSERGGCAYGRASILDSFERVSVPRAISASPRARKYYVVRRGYVTGLFTSWAECESQVKGFSNAEFKSFKVREEAVRYLGLGR
jgi:hypothetical protein